MTTTLNGQMLLANRTTTSIGIFSRSESDGEDTQQMVDELEEANHYRIQMYKRVIPVFLALSLLAILANALVIVALRSARVRRNATVTLLTSLTSSDIWSCLVMSLSLLYNSYLPIVLQTEVEPCLALSLEMLRTGGLLTAALHLLLIALHHCVGIIRPHFNKDRLRHSILVLCAFAWVVPPAILWLLALIRPNQGFWNCERPDFYYTRAFRWTVSALLASIFCAITLCYAKLLCILRSQHEKWPQLLQNHQQQQQQQKTAQHRPSLALFRDSRRSTAADAVPCAEVPPPTAAPLCSKRRRRERRTLWTTLLICASFLLGWAPASLLFALTCADCQVLASPAHFRVLFALSCTQLAFLLAKSLLNPLIYSLRIPEVNAHIRKCISAAKCGASSFCCCWDTKNGPFARRMTTVSISGDTQRLKMRKRRSHLFVVSSNSSLAHDDNGHKQKKQQQNNWSKTAAELVKRKARLGLLVVNDGAGPTTRGGVEEDSAVGEHEKGGQKGPRSGTTTQLVSISCTSKGATKTERNADDEPRARENGRPKNDTTISAEEGQTSDCGDICC